MADYWRLMADHTRAPRLVVVVSADPNAGNLVRDWLPDHRIVTVDPQSAAGQIAGLLPQAIILDAAIASQPEIGELLENLPYDPPVLTIELPGSAPHLHKLPAGLVACLTKPVLRSDLTAAVRRLSIASPLLLVIDDDPAVARFVRLALAEENEGAGFEVVSATAGAMALDWLKETDRLPGAILLDLRLPDMSGWDLLCHLQESPLWRAIPVIAITAISLSEELAVRARRSIQVTTARSLTSEEQAAAIMALLEAIRPTFPAGPIAPGRPENRSA